MRLALMLAVVGLCACSEDSGTLSGSLGDYYDLTFDHARARLYSSDLAIEFVATDGQVPVRVSVSRHSEDGDEDVLEAGSYNLEERGDITGQRGDTRIPRFISGKLHLTKFSPEQGAAIEGTFEATFETGRDESTLSGEFKTTLEVVDGPKGYGFDAGPDGDDDAGGDTGADTGDT